MDQGGPIAYSGGGESRSTSDSEIAWSGVANHRRRRSRGMAGGTPRRLRWERDLSRFLLFCAARTSAHRRESLRIGAKARTNRRKSLRVVAKACASPQKAVQIDAKACASSQKPAHRRKRPYKSTQKPVQIDAKALNRRRLWGSRRKKGGMAAWRGGAMAEWRKGEGP